MYLHTFTGDFMTQYYTVSKAASKLGVSVDTVQRWLKNGDINYVQVGAGWRRIPQSEIDRVSMGTKHGYLRPVCPVCNSSQLSWKLGAGNGLSCLTCGTEYFLTVGKSRKNVPHENYE